MKFSAVVVVLALATPVFLTETYTVWYDTLYDETQASLSSVTCSNGKYGLINYGYTTFGSIPSYPFIGGAPQIQSWDSPNCGTCWSLTYTDLHDNGWAITFAAINSGTRGGFTISLAGMNALTNGNALMLDGASITAARLPATACGF